MEGGPDQWRGSRGPGGPVPFYDWDDCSKSCSWVFSEAFHEDFDCGFYFDELGSFCWDGCDSEDDFFSSVRVCEGADSHFASSVAQGVQTDVYDVEFDVFAAEPLLFYEGVDESSWDVPFSGILWDTEDLCFKLLLEFFRVQS